MKTPKRPVPRERLLLLGRAWSERMEARHVDEEAYFPMGRGAGALAPAGLAGVEWLSVQMANHPAFDLVKPGMSRDEVVATLGRVPGDYTSRPWHDRSDLAHRVV